MANPMEDDIITIAERIAHNDNGYWPGDPEALAQKVLANEQQTQGEIDYDQLNDAAQTFYYAAYAKGFRAGDEAGASRIAEDRTRGGVALAIDLLRGSVSARDTFADTSVSHTRPGSDWPERVLAMHARTMLGRVSAYPDVVRTLDLLKDANLNNAPGGINRRKVDQALKHLTSYLETLGGYR